MTIKTLWAVIFYTILKIGHIYSPRGGNCDCNSHLELNKNSRKFLGDRRINPLYAERCNKISAIYLCDLINKNIKS